jgi:hypothetical protein
MCSFSTAAVQLYVVSKKSFRVSSTIQLQAHYFCISAGHELVHHYSVVQMRAIAAICSRSVYLQFCITAHLARHIGQRLHRYTVIERHVATCIHAREQLMLQHY